MKNDNLDELFGETISSYSRAQALEDGVLVDAGATAREAGFTVPVAITANLWAAIESIPTSGHGAEGDVAGRLWDVLWMAKLAARRGGESVTFVVILPFRGTRTRNQRLRAVIGPGDQAEPVITIGFEVDQW